MNLSKKTDYALRALFTLVEHQGGAPIPIRELARRNEIPRRFLEQIMLQMRAKRWVKSVAGKRGGYLLAKRPEEITMGEVVRFFDGYLAPIACVSARRYERCSQETVCRFRRVLLEARNLIARLMEEATLARVMRGAPVAPSEIFTLQGRDGDGI
ncbi:MAG: Rrf2 family transcriptional regulator [Verrucomicrobiae bacterium]|nr:Rrf2 family transcriptional regulator [Verrucomicrobiae bacterium]